MDRSYSTSLLITAFFLAFAAFDVQADSPNLELASTKNDDHFVVTKPLVFWKSNPGAGKGKWFYAISEALFSKANLINKVDQLDDCIMKPREPYESGSSRNCLWMNCIIQHDNQWMMYYGAGDRNVGLATAPVN
jgi:hypothetical protein